MGYCGKSGWPGQPAASGTEAVPAMRFWCGCVISVAGFFALALPLRFGVAAVPLALPLCHGMACRSCRDGQLLLEEQK